MHIFMQNMKKRANLQLFFQLCKRARSFNEFFSEERMRAAMNRCLLYPD